MERDLRIDNLKAFLIFSVVLGHAFEMLCGITGIYGIIRAVLYSFHMPAFVFLSGYLARISKSTTQLTVVKYLCSYAIFNTLFGLSPFRAYSPLIILTPQPIYWYCICLCYWRISIQPLSKIRFITPISIALCLYVGCFDQADRFLSISRAICFFPFFLIGYHFQMNMIERFKKSVAWIILLVSLSLIALVEYFKLFPVKMYEYIQSYSATNVGIAEGVAIRLTMIVLSLIVIISLLVISPSKKHWVTKIGRNSLIIYLIHIFPIKIVQTSVHLNQENSFINIFVCLAFSCIICILLSFNVLSTTFSKITNSIASYLTTSKS